jgi:hypothetical protein
VDLSPSRLKLCILILGSAGWVLAQDAPPQALAAPPVTEREPGSIAGVVRSDATGQPLRRAQVSLSPAEAGGTARAQTTDEAGKFSFSKIVPGSYSITVERDGYLKQLAGRIGAYKMPPTFVVQPGQDISSFEFRMAPWGVVSGTVKFDDADPAVNVTVQLYREYYTRGRHGWEAGARTQTNDRGEYRVHGLEPGSYYIAALYQAPRFLNPEEKRPTDASGHPAQELSYAVTFYPEVQKLTDAVAVRVLAGQELASLDIFLTPVHTVHIRGRVYSALSGAVVQGPNLSLRWNDAENTASVTAPVNVNFDKDQSFEIKGIPPGPYFIVTTGVEDGKTLTARTPISVGESDVDGISIVIGPQQTWKGKVTVNGDASTDLTGLVVELQPRRSTTFGIETNLDDKREFELNYVPQETYDIGIRHAPDDVYLEAVRAGKADRLATGLEAEPGGEAQELEVVLSTRGGKVMGRAVTATDSNVTATGASVMLIPDPPIGRWHAYKSAYADQYGNFLIRGIAPGNYIALAWFDQPPCEVYNPNDQAACQEAGAKLTVSEEALESIQLPAH